MQYSSAMLQYNENAYFNININATMQFYSAILQYIETQSNPTQLDLLLLFILTNNKGLVAEWSAFQTGKLSDSGSIPAKVKIFFGEIKSPIVLIKF